MSDEIELTEHQMYVMYEEFLKLNQPSYKFEWLQQIPECIDDKPVRSDVVNFIANFLYERCANPIEAIMLFRCGYCYHFAVILRDLFGGSIVIDDEVGHIYWKDECDILYDINGPSEISDRILKKCQSIESFRDKNPKRFHNYLHID